MEYLVSLGAVAARVGDPQIAVAIDRGAVREVEHAGAPAFQQLPVCVELENRGLGAIDAARMEKTRDLLSEALELPQRLPIDELYAPGFTPPAS